MGMSNRSALLVAYDSELLGPHARAFASAGFEVVRANSMSLALGAVGPGNIGVLVFAPGIPPGDRRRVEAEASRRNPHVCIILLYEGGRERDVFASAILEAATAPEQIVALAADLLAAA